MFDLIKQLTIVLMVAFILGAVGYFVLVTKQIAHYYPNPDNLEEVYQSPQELLNHGTCREWARTYARENRYGTQGVYACGTDCTYSTTERYWNCKDYTLRHREALYDTLKK